MERSADITAGKDDEFAHREGAVMFTGLCGGFRGASLPKVSTGTDTDSRASSDTG